MSGIEVEMDENMIVCNVIVNAHECEGSIAEANDCLRSVWGKLEWYDRKQRFCPHLISSEDSVQVKTLIDRVTAEESPVMEYDHKLRSGYELNSDLQSRVEAVCEQFRQMKKLLLLLYNNINSILKNQSFVRI